MANLTPELDETSAAATKPRRVLACVLCQQRKVKCNRKLPCANCVRAGARCVPFTPRPRRRRFPERELLERLRHYENLLRQNSINFEPLHATATAAEHASAGEDGRPSEASRVNVLPRSKDTVDLWHAMSRVALDPEDDDEESDADGGNPGDHYPHRNAINKNAFTPTGQAADLDRANDYLLFGALSPNADLLASHPEQVQIFRLWQIYLDNVNPLLKVTHIPTLQPRIINAASDIASINPTLEALLFSIYCISIVSLAEDECYALFRSPRKVLLAGYQSACQQALLKCSLWRSGDRGRERDCDGLTALYLYLVSVKFQTNPGSLSCMLAVAIRIAERMGIHSESTHTRCSALDAEMCRRLWWSLVTFDHRICELSDYKTTTLAPTWDCSIPLNVNDFEIRPDMKNSPLITHKKPTEALFAVVRSELADSMRHSTFHLTFVNPSLNMIAAPKDARHPPVSKDSELVALEKTIEDKYLTFCDADDPLHYMTIWSTRGSLARGRLLEYFSRHSTSSTRPTEAQRSAALCDALSMLECDTKLRTSPLTKRYLWFIDLYFPALAYVHVLNDLGMRPAEDYAKKAWDAMSDNYEVLVSFLNEQAGDEEGGIYSNFAAFSRLVLQTWEAREGLLRQQHKPSDWVPRIVTAARNKVLQTSSSIPSKSSNEEQPNHGSVGVYSADNYPMFTPPMDLGSNYGAGGGQSFMGLGPAGYHPDMSGQVLTDVDMDQFWTEINWEPMDTQGW